ncbi:aquaporin-like protein [Aspergillus aculeatinus CBS 121060]|uniref:Aquaporin-like protein n=1 Tax=Aspergillus aculeatinus CBS 121060 TaxID=1448322 RepID=A0ACD1GU53_9EURO|nr:aquaporin-like protein [Aspergillus aculeatinus CBS 121060]RAH64978.1 aquaporin-like protein [Aspergillus aculeatinus CBS 121060]
MQDASQNTDNHFLAASSEFVGTVLFLWFAFAGTQVAAMTSTSASASDTITPQRLLYISLSFGMSLLVVAWAFYRISGGIFNPAVRQPSPLFLLRCAFLLPAQILGAHCGRRAGLMFLTTLLLLVTILMLAAEKHNATFLAPVGIGLALFVAELAGVYFTGGSLNPARSFGPDVAAASFPGYHYIYWVGPLMGALLAAGYYRFAKAFNYPEANPGQDATGPKE